MAVCKLVTRVRNFRKGSFQFAFECCVVTNAANAEQHPESLEGQCAACEEDSPVSMPLSDSSDLEGFVTFFSSPQHLILSDFLCLCHHISTMFNHKALGLKGTK